MLRLVECAQLQVLFKVVMAYERHEEPQKQQESLDETADVANSIPQAVSCSLDNLLVGLNIEVNAIDQLFIFLALLGDVVLAIDGQEFCFESLQAERVKNVIIHVEHVLFEVEPL